MRAVEIALLILCLQIGLGLVATTGLFSGMYYESEITDSPGDLPGTGEYGDEMEQEQTAAGVMEALWNIVTWGWISDFFEPFYSQNADLASFVDTLSLMIGGIANFIVGVAFITFIRNRVSILG